MEYTFKLSPHSEVTSIHLGDYSLSLRKGTTEQKIAYANIFMVRMDVNTHSEYSIYLDADGYGQIAIPSWTFTDQGKKESQSSGYSLFVRVLHHHLQDKCRANFKSGKDAGRIGLWAGIGAVLSVVVSFLMDYLGFGWINPPLQALFFSVVAVMLILVFSIKKLPKSYHPSNIPLQFLP
ncbi:MAG TPA: hypothetical protein PLR06_06120 [Cyclobacteriaceae bacterium]|nr:hypothetical protein [Cyclobacteriaceae bacterium]